ncbi:MAG: hypothetical protein M1814_004822 [Vezdaea aestivalis]|nr:MAG: hypothetical protein M1814_004822 [Vezdaea aestivalis]
MESPKGKENPHPPQLAGTKRPADSSAPGLLPAIDFLSSSPMGRPSKRQARARQIATSEDTYKSYPTPVPSSSVGNIPSSPPIQAVQPPKPNTRPAMHERAPLSAVPSVTLDEAGEQLLMGRSSGSSQYQLSANRLISRVHVKAKYILPTAPEYVGKIEVVCLGWNGLKLHSQGKTWNLGKEDSFTSETEGAEIMIDVQDARVILRWPDRSRFDDLSEESALADSPSARPVGETDNGLPRRYSQRLQSPVSPSPRHVPSSSTLFGSDAIYPSTVIKIYEDEPSSEDHAQAMGPPSDLTQSTIRPTQSFNVPSQVPSLVSQGMTQPDTPGLEEYSDHEEENDPIIASFGPTGDDLLPRMASLGSQQQVRKIQVDVVAKEEDRGRVTERSDLSKPRSLSESTNEAENTALVNHVINQLAFSRLSSTPISAILASLPAELKGEDPTQAENKGLSLSELKNTLDATRCIGEIVREGKDAAGKRLESEYYYIPTEDLDEKRREAVVDGLQKPGLRACRKQHKRYYWRKPK